MGNKLDIDYYQKIFYSQIAKNTTARTIASHTYKEVVLLETLYLSGVGKRAV